jgi:hypothetical protein
LGTLVDPGLGDDHLRVGVFVAGFAQPARARDVAEVWAAELTARGGVYARRPEISVLDDRALDLDRLEEEREPFVVVGRPAPGAAAALDAWVRAREVPWLREAAAGDAASAWTVDLDTADAAEPPLVAALRALTQALARVGRDVSRERLVQALR